MLQGTEFCCPRRKREREKVEKETETRGMKRQQKRSCWKDGKMKVLKAGKKELQQKEQRNGEGKEWGKNKKRHKKKEEEEYYKDGN
jgi:hypothetical protein